MNKGITCIVRFYPQDTGIISKCFAITKIIVYFENKDYAINKDKFPSSL